MTLDDDVVRSAAEEDPRTFVESGDGLLVIDEVQRAPRLLLAIKASVDRDRRHGRFLLAGSANLLRLRSIQDSLAGRAETVELFGLSQGELDGRSETFIDDLFADGPATDYVSTLGRDDYLTRACAGGFPEAVFRSETRRDAWFAAYASRLLERDASAVGEYQRLGDLPRLLALVAARSSAELNMTDLAADAAFPARTLPAYLDLLETLYLSYRVPAWATNLTGRIVKRPKIVLTDTGLLAHLLHLSSDRLALHLDPAPAGMLIETFVVNEIRKQLGWACAPVRMYHFRERSGAEVDVVLEHRDGRIAAIEIRSGATPDPRAARGLKALRDVLGTRFVHGMVLYSGPDALPFGDRISLQPIDVLWRS